MADTAVQRLLVTSRQLTMSQSTKTEFPKPSRKDTIVYVLSGAARDRYSVMTRISIGSVRITNPFVRIVVVCDRLSANALRMSCDPLLDEVDELLYFDTPSGNSKFRNRFVKTNIRSILDGPFLYLDGDTVVRSSLNGALSLDCDVAGAPDQSADELDRQCCGGDREMLELMRWNIRSDAFINAGVLFFNDTVDSYRLGKTWHEKWRQTHSKSNDLRDQPSFNNALLETGVSLIVLPHSLNAQFKLSPRAAVGAVIWHYYASATQVPTTEFELLVRDVLHGRVLQQSDIRTMIERSIP